MFISERPSVVAVTSAGGPGGEPGNITTVDPWDLDQLLQGDTDLQAPMSAWKKYAMIILPHIGLILLSLTYIVGGALAFYHLESPNEHAVRGVNLQRIGEHRRAMLNHIYHLVNDNRTTHEDLEREALQQIDTVSRLLFEAFDTHYISASHLRNGRDPNSTSEDQWTLITAVFFTTTLLTTIVPVTIKGRMFCVSYALFGVPLILITVADIGKFLSENIIWLYTRYAQAKRRCRTPTVPMSVDDPNSRAPAVKDQLMQFGLEHYISIPITLIVAILLGYIAMGAVLLGSWENWDFFSGFYFSFITMTTVGFGDIVPVNQGYFLFDLFYIIVGLAITTMCIDLVGIQYIRKIHYFGRAIKDARFALVNVGGKMVHVPDLMRYASVLQQKYGQKKTTDGVYVRGAYAPKDLTVIRYIDYGALASMESVSTFLSSIFGKSREPSAV